MEGASLTSFSPSVLIRSHMREQREGDTNEAGLQPPQVTSSSCTYTHDFKRNCTSILLQSFIVMSIETAF